MAAGLEAVTDIQHAVVQPREGIDVVGIGAADWRDFLQRQLDELKRIEDEPIPTDLMRDEDGNLVNARGFLDDDGNVIDD